jgi:hypothetical protein
VLAYLSAETSFIRAFGNRTLLLFFLCVLTRSGEILKLVPSKPGCAGYDWTRQFTDFSFQGGTPSMFCIRDVTDGMPWIYPPAQTYFYVACVAACIYLTYQIIRTWPQARGRPN